MAIESYETQLERVQTAIARIEEGAQTYQINGRSLSRADLGDLYAKEKWLRRQVERASRGGIRVRGVTPVR